MPGPLRDLALRLQEALGGAAMLGLLWVSEFVCYPIVHVVDRHVQ